MTTYSVNVTPKLTMGCMFYTVAFMSHDEDGTQVEGVVGRVYEAETANTMRDLWLNSATRPAVFALMSAELPHPNDDHPDPTDIEEMKYC